MQTISLAEISKIGGKFGPDQITKCCKATIYKIYLSIFKPINILPPLLIMNTFTKMF